MTTTTALILPTTVTQADIQAAAYTLGQCLRFNADTLPFRELTEGWNVRLLLDRLTAPAASVPAAPDGADVPSTTPPHTAPVKSPGKPMTNIHHDIGWLGRIMEKLNKHLWMASEN